MKTLKIKWAVINQLYPQLNWFRKIALFFSGRIKVQYIPVAEMKFKQAELPELAKYQPSFPNTVEIAAHYDDSGKKIPYEHNQQSTE